MTRALSFLTALVASFCSLPLLAAEKQFDGQGFDCYFQTGKQKLDRLSMWYGGMRHKNDKTPQFQDLSKLFVLNGFIAGSKMTIYVSDKWPEKFEFQYFQLDSGSSPLSLLNVFGDESEPESYRAEIVHLPKNIAKEVTVQPTKRIGGMCSYNPAVTLAAFRSLTQP
jgi:hypothetical protein